MQYQIIGQTVPAVECTLMRGESMFTQSGGMIWETEGISMKTNARGGIAKSLGRLLSGESIFMANYTAEQDNVRIAFGSTVPGSVIPVDVGTTPLIVQKGAFLCAEQSVQLDITLTKKLSAGFFGGEGFVLQKLSGTGMAFLEVDGDIVQYDLRAGEVLKVDTGNVVAFDPNVQYEIETVKGLGNILLGGEGLFLTRLTGPGRVILQTQNFNDFAGRIIARIPKSN
ncbi:MAG: TIGR00266 family protein [Oscillospiraceae bacterium]|nr:TIGR00266 family protein [Oscillospiraceae bacterium]